MLAAQTVSVGAGTGILAACLTLPHLAGPLVAPLLDRWTAKRALLATAGVVYGVALLGAAILLVSSLVWASAGCLVVAGAMGPMLTGGLSSRLSDLAGRSSRTARRVQGMDALTYGIGASIGPAFVGVSAAAFGPFSAIGATAVVAIIGAALILTLPRVVDGKKEGTTANPWRAVSVLFREPGLFRTTIITAITAIPLGAMPLIAVASAEQARMPAANTAGLMTAFGVGNLLASLGVIMVPLRGEANRLVIRTGAVVAATFGLGLLVTWPPIGYVVFALIGAASGVLFTASLAARSAYSPPGAAGQVFISMAGIKVACSSSGAALAGAFLPIGGFAMFAIATVFAFGALGIAALDRRRPLDPATDV
ncbi:MFS transporter [Microbacterium sp. A8/3-1]|uniref:MFS transporter n=1 Tax=Microbacterium sp. A8/3-1 TaxID=3160749 RepID=A0AAU7W2C5_9MICO